MTSPAESLTRDIPSTVSRLPVRLALISGHHPGRLDGAWWPQSPDLLREARALADRLHAEIGDVARLLFSRPDWAAPASGRFPRHLRTAGGRVDLHSFPSDDTHIIIVTAASGRQLRLLVIPSATEPALAQAAMRSAVDENDTSSPGAMLGLAGPDQSEIGDAVWNDHAGSPAWGV